MEKLLTGLMTQNGDFQTARHASLKILTFNASNPLKSLQAAYNGTQNAAYNGIHHKLVLQKCHEFFILELRIYERMNTFIHEDI
jgi:hypothetical protein